VRVTPINDRQFPPALGAATAVTFDYADGEGVDFEPFPEFLSAEETSDWFRSWTGNSTVTGDGFRVFGQDGTGGYAAFWMIRPHAVLMDQPIVFLGSEGEVGVVARDLASFLWLLADGFGPYEAVDPRERDRAARPIPELARIAESYAPDRRQAAGAVMEQAVREFPSFEATVMALCR
jgi:hypothetical protein